MAWPGRPVIHFAIARYTGRMRLQKRWGWWLLLSGFCLALFGAVGALQLDSFSPDPLRLAFRRVQLGMTTNEVDALMKGVDGLKTGRVGGGDDILVPDEQLPIPMILDKTTDTARAYYDERPNGNKKNAPFHPMTSWSHDLALVASWGWHATTAFLPTSTSQADNSVGTLPKQRNSSYQPGPSNGHLHRGQRTKRNRRLLVRGQWSCVWLVLSRPRAAYREIGLAPKPVRGTAGDAA
jgi:hypothetical protein